tara:strand:- start:367 stop:1059 length:693 start_codon:yes stop_codon:yes gene_type:complete
MKITLCVLTLNERPSLEVTFPKVQRFVDTNAFDEVVAIDGGSTDGTLEYFEDIGIDILSQSRSGRGEAMLTAFNELDCDAYLFFSPDGNEDVADLPKFRPLLENGAEIIIASRMMPGAYNEEDDKILRWRKWANKAFTFLANGLFRKCGPYVTDTINGYRAITRATALDLGLDAADYSIEYQISIRGLKKRKNIVEFPTIEGHRIAGATGAPSFPTGLRFLRRLWWELFT